MAACVRAIQQPDGTLSLALDPTAQDVSTCQYVLQDGTPNAWQELGNLSLDQSQQIAFAIGGLWALAFTFRLIGRAIDPFKNESES